METAMHRPPFGQVRWSTYYSYCRYPLLVPRPSVIPKPDLILTRFSIHPFLNFPPSFLHSRKLVNTINWRRTIRLVPDDGFPKRKERDQVESIAVSKIQWQTGGLAALRMRSIVKLRIDSDLATTPTFPPSFRHALLRSRARTIPSRSIHGICVRFRAIVHDSASNLFFFFFFWLSANGDKWISKKRSWRICIQFVASFCSSFFFPVTRSIPAVETILGRKNVTSRAMIHATWRLLYL